MARKVLLFWFVAAAALATACSGSETQQHPRYIPPPRPVTAPPETRGSALTAEQMEDIERTIQVGQEQVIRCYEDELERRGNKNLSGRVSVRMQLGTAGKALSVEVTQSTLKVEAVHQCIIDAVMGWEFPPLDSAQPYSTTFDLSPAY